MSMRNLLADIAAHIVAGLLFPTDDRLAALSRALRWVGLARRAERQLLALHPELSPAEARGHFHRMLERAGGLELFLWELR